MFQSFFTLQHYFVRLELRCPSWHYFSLLCNTLPFLTRLCPVLSYFVLDITLSLLVVLCSWYYFVFLGTALSYCALFGPSRYCVFLSDISLSYLVLLCPSWHCAFVFGTMLSLVVFTLFFCILFCTSLTPAFLLPFLPKFFFWPLCALQHTLSLLIYFSIHKVIFLSAPTPILINTIHYSL